MFLSSLFVPVQGVRVEFGVSRFNGLSPAGFLEIRATSRQVLKNLLLFLFRLLTMFAMKSLPFVHLHLHTCYSLLDGACRIDQVMERAVEEGMSSVAMTDHGVMYGAVEFYKSANEHGIKPVLGCEVYVADGDHRDRGKQAGRRQPRINHLVLLAQNDVGFQNLTRLVSIAHLDGFYYKPRIDHELLAEYHEGLIGMSACLKGEVASGLLDGNMEAAKQAAGQYVDILGKDNFFIEIQDHGLPEQREVNRYLPTLAGKMGLPLVASNDVHYLKKEHGVAHEVLLCLQTQTVMSDPKRMRYQTNEFYMKSAAEMTELFKEHPEAITNTVDIAERCNVELEFGKLHFPIFKTPEGISHKDYLIKLGHEGLVSHYQVTNPNHPKNDFEKRVINRFNTEMDIVEKAGYINYYLVVADFVGYAKRVGIPVGPGRGSGGGSLLAYVTGIIDIDPLHYGLIFERFLNLERVSPPDFDIDFCQARRGEVIEYVKNKYGRESCAQIITFGSLGAKTVIRDVGRVLEIPYDECDKLAKMIPGDPKMNLKKALDVNPEFKKAYETNKNCKRILEYGFVLEGLYRNPGIHAAGIVIGEKPLIEIVPLSRDKNKEIITQYSWEELGDIGLLKMDFLGLKTLTVIEESVGLIKMGKGVEIDPSDLAMDDKKTYELFNRGDTIGVFQLESSGMRDLIRRVGIDKIDDLIAMIALYRPGPMNMLDDFVKRKGGRSKIKYDHPLLEPILKETYGVMLYQEQVLKTANVLAGYSLGEADILRRAMGKKKAEVMEQQRAKFVAGCEKNNKIKPSVAGRVFDMVAKFAGYGFPKAHSTGYGLIAYQTAFLKANYPAEFMAALLSSEIGNFDKLPVFTAEAKEMGLEILPPDVNESDVRFSPVEGGIRFGMAGIKNVGAGAVEAIVEDRRQNGPYKGLMDFCSRVDGTVVNKKVIESLARCGGFDSCGQHRARLFNGVDFAMSRAASSSRDKQDGQGSLFELLDEGDTSLGEGDIPDCEAWPESQQLAAEKELLGLYMSGHPLAQYACLLKRYQLSDVQNLANLEEGSSTRLGGIVSTVTTKVTRKKERMAFLRLEDLDGSVEVLVFPDVYNEYSASLRPESAVLVCGDISKKEEEVKLVAREIYPLAQAPKYFATKLGVHLFAAGLDVAKIERVRDIMRLHPGDVPAVICLQFPSCEKVFLDTDRSYRVNPAEKLVQELEHELGEGNVYVGVNPKPCRRERAPRRRFARSNGS